MAHIIYRPADGDSLARQVIINGHDFSNEVYRDMELVEVGEDDYAEVGLRVTFVVSRLDLGGDQDVEITDHFPAVATAVRSMAEEAGE